MIHWEIRPVADARVPAIAYREGDLVIVEVDDTLTGRQRTAAIMDVLRPYRRGLAALLPLPVLLFGHSHPRGSAAIASTAGVAIVGGALLVLTAVGEREHPSPGVVNAMPTASITVTASGPTVTRLRTRTPPPSRATTPRAGLPTDAATSDRSPSERGDPTTSRTIRSTTSPPTASPDDQSPPTTTSPPSDPGAPAAERPRSPTVEPQSTSPPSTGMPTAAAAGCDGLVHLDVDPLLDVCLL